MRNLLDQLYFMPLEPIHFTKNRRTDYFITQINDMKLFFNREKIDIVQEY